MRLEGLTTEQMMPVMPVVRVSDANRAIDLAVEVERGNRHTAVMHSKNLDNLSRMAKACDCSIFVKNPLAGRSPTRWRRLLLVHDRQPHRRRHDRTAIVLTLAPLRAGRSLQDHVMKKPSVLEFADIPTGVWAVDSILKKAPIAFVRAGTVTRGRYLVVFGGSTAATAESLAEALATSGKSVIDLTFLGEPCLQRGQGRRREAPATNDSSYARCA